MPNDTERGLREGVGRELQAKGQSRKTCGNELSCGSWAELVPVALIVPVPCGVWCPDLLSVRAGVKVEVMARAAGIARFHSQVLEEPCSALAPADVILYLGSVNPSGSGPPGLPAPWKILPTCPHQSPGTLVTVAGVRTSLFRDPCLACPQLQPQ